MTALLDCAAHDAEQAHATFGNNRRKPRVTLRETIAEDIEKRAAATGLPHARHEEENGRTTGQLHVFASPLRTGDYFDRRNDPALPCRVTPRPGIRMTQRPGSPMAAFGASNLLAFSVAGEASALAAGCPVVVKSQSARPGTGEVVARAIKAAIARGQIAPRAFILIQGGNGEISAPLVSHRHLVETASHPLASAAVQDMLIDAYREGSRPLPATANVQQHLALSAGPGRQGHIFTSPAVRSGCRRTAWHKRCGRRRIRICPTRFFTRTCDEVFKHARRRNILTTVTRGWP